MPLFHSSLERAVGTAEAMEARGFGAGNRTRWQRRRWAHADGLAIAMAVFTLALASILSMFLDGAPTYYPEVEVGMTAVTMMATVALAMLVAVPGSFPGRSAEGGGTAD